MNTYNIFYTTADGTYGNIKVEASDRKDAYIKAENMLKKKGIVPRTAQATQVG